ncbi:MAG: hypothetical protein QW260_08420, partial [Thermoproteota archaeon]
MISEKGLSGGFSYAIMEKEIGYFPGGAKMLQKIVSDFIRYAEGRRSPRLVSVYRTMGRRFCAFAEERKRRSLGEVKNLEFLQDFLRFLSSFRPRS